MKKLRKVLPIFVVVVMMFGLMTIGAFADFPIEKTVTSESGITPESTFTFTMDKVTVEAGTQDENGNEVSTGIGDQKTATVNFSNGDELTKTVNMLTSDITFPGPGIYRYEVKETTGTVSGIQYDTTKYIVDIYVTTNTETGALEQTAVVSHKEGQTEKAPIKFNNTYATQPLEIKKEVTGNMGDKNLDFNFTLTIAPCDTLAAGTTIAAVKHVGTQTENVTVTVGTPYNFTLKHGEFLTVASLPVGAEYTVTETEANQNGYTTTVTGVDQTGKGTIAEGTNTVTFVNDKDQTTPTGIILDVAPYAAVVLLAIAGCVALVAKKRKEER